MLEVHHIFKTYEGQPLLTDISFTVAEGETICLLGASGSGKSTLLRIIAGLEEPDSGFVSFDEMNLTSTPPHRRDFGLVFQDYALFPHLNVQENVAFGLKMRRLPAAEIVERVAGSLEMVNLSGFENRRVTELSGGEQQRIALARALATRPRLLMFDEPLGALDRTLREDLLDELRAILHQTSIPAIYVTHDQEEAFAIADRVLILHDGQIVREGAPADVWADPQSVFVAEFLGLGNIIQGEVSGKRRRGAAATPALSPVEGTKEGTWEIESNRGIFTVDCGHEHQKGDRVHLLARPLPAGGDRASTAGRDASQPDPPLSANVLRGVVTDVTFQQDRFHITLDNGLRVYLTEAPKVGQEIEVQVRVECLA